MEPINLSINSQLKKINNKTASNPGNPSNHNSYIYGSYQCNDCNDTGYVLSGSGLDMAATRCKCLKNKSIQRKIKSARISTLLRKCSFDKFDSRYYSNKIIKGGSHSYREMAEKALDAAASFVHNVLENQLPDSLLFVGKTGRGKTYLAASIANEILDRKPDIGLLFVVVPDLLNEIRSTYDNKNNTHSEFDIIDTARNADILILDDLGAHNYSDWVKDKLYSIIDYRLQEQLPTVITTNLLDPPSMDQVLGERITSRIFQLCRVYRMMCERDIRLINSYEDMLNVFSKNDNLNDKKDKNDKIDNLNE
ncbi:ATP-binding protein [Desulfuribacillus alkaliarsenatis]|uniref:AAA+ ATPase domain-containing protein n=1 Tax=Desulfuribacillus alkaliarsenatis TaxID=766136 RepID=A0A1E5FZH8_9FIRM|nr:ATP-binding protein [Desulfuribacillus alkaliarsenatis]OEF95995.1 hypothetical protein BHF68_09600 [Desulfuribacillus alkaliarsenatis]